MRAITRARVNAPVFVSVVVSVRREDIHKLLLIAIVEKEDGAGDAVAHADELVPRLGRGARKRGKRGRVFSRSHGRLQKKEKEERVEERRAGR